MIDNDYPRTKQLVIYFRPHHYTEDISGIDIYWSTDEDDIGMQTTYTDERFLKVDVATGSVIVRIPNHPNRTISQSVDYAWRCIQSLYEPRPATAAGFALLYTRDAQEVILDKFNMTAQQYIQRYQIKEETSNAE